MSRNGSLICTCGMSVHEETWGNHLKGGGHKSKMARLRETGFALPKRHRKRRRRSRRW